MRIATKKSLIIKNNISGFHFNKDIYDNKFNSMNCYYNQNNKPIDVIVDVVCHATTFVRLNLIVPEPLNRGRWLGMDGTGYQGGPRVWGQDFFGEV